MGNTGDELEIGQFRAIDKGPLKGFFSIVIYPRQEKIIDCTYFISGENRWINLPQKEIKMKDGGKSDYIPIISYPTNKEYMEALKIAALAALKDTHNQEQNGKAQSQTDNRKPDQVRSSPPANWEECPF